MSQTARAEEANPLHVIDKLVVQHSSTILASPKVQKLKAGVMVVAPVNLAVAGAAGGELAEVQAIASFVQTKLSTAFINGGGERLEVVDQVVIEKAIQTLKSDLASVSDPDNWKILKEKTGARYVLLSSGLVMSDGTFSADIRLVDMDSKRAVAAAGVTGSMETGVINPQPETKPKPAETK